MSADRRVPNHRVRLWFSSPVTAVHPLDGGRDLREHPIVEAMFPSPRLTRALLLAGTAGALATCVVFALEFGSDLGDYVWAAPFLAGYAAGVVAVRARPEHVAARRLLALGAASTIFISAAVALSLALRQPGPGVVAGSRERLGAAARAGPGGGDDRAPRGVPRRRLRSSL